MATDNGLDLSGCSVSELKGMLARQQITPDQFADALAAAAQAQVAVAVALARQKGSGCPITRTQFMASGERTLDVGGNKIKTTPRLFAADRDGNQSFGYNVCSKITLDVGGTPVRFQFSGNLVAIGSKDAVAPSASQPNGRAQGEVPAPDSSIVWAPPSGAIPGTPAKPPAPQLARK